MNRDFIRVRHSFIACKQKDDHPNWWLVVLQEKAMHPSGTQQIVIDADVGAKCPGQRWSVLVSADSGNASGTDRF